MKKLLTLLGMVTLLILTSCGSDGGSGSGGSSRKKTLTINGDVTKQ